MKNTNEEKINNLYLRLLDKFGNERGKKGVKRFRIDKKEGVSKYLYFAAKYATNIVDNNVTKKIRPETKKLALGVAELNISVEDLSRFSNLAVSRYKMKTNSKKPNKKVTAVAKIGNVEDILQKAIDERITSCGLVDTIDALDEIVNRLRSKKNESLDKLRILEKELYGESLK